MPQKIGVPTLKRLVRSPPDRETEIRDTAIRGFVVKALPSGAVRFYAQLGRGKRETIAHEQGSGSRKTLRGFPVDARDVLDRSKSSISLSWVRRECQRLQGAQIGGEDFSAQRQAERAIPTFERFLDAVYGPWLRDNPDHRDARGTLERLRTVFGKDFGRDKLDTLTPRRLDAWKARRLKGGATPATVNRDLTALKAALAAYARWNERFRNPLRGYKGIKVDPNRKIVRAFDEDEVTRLLQACADRDAHKRVERASGNQWREARGYKPLPALGVYADCLTPTVIVSLETGLRRGELFGLRWPFVDFKARTIQVEPETAKSARGRVVPLSDTAHQTLRDWWLQNGQPKRGRVFPVSNLKKSYHAVLADAAVTRVGEDGKRLNWHSLRHTFGSRLGAAGVDPETIRDMMGHSSLATTQRYLHTTADRKRRAIEALA